MDIQKVVDRIRKLRALSQSANAHEAAAAAAEAQRLMTEYQVAEASLLTNEAQDFPVVDEDILLELGVTRRQIDSWELDLCAGVGQANNCKVYKTQKRFGGPRGTLHIVGRQLDVDAVKYLFVLFRNEVDKLAERWALVQQGLGHDVVSRTTKTAFKLGCAQEIRNRLTAERGNAGRALKAASHLGSQQATNALAVFDKTMAKAEEYLRNLPGLRAHRGAGPTNLGAFREGQEAGRGVDLGRGSKRIGEGARRLGSAS